MNPQMLSNCRTGLALTFKAIAEGAFGDPNLAQRVKVLEGGGEIFRRFEQDALRKFFGGKFKELRASKGLTLKEMAAKVSLHPSTVAAWESLA